MSLTDELERVKQERDAMAAECEAWSSMAVALANKYPVDSQTFDYMDEIRSTDWGECLAKRDALMKAEALECLQAEANRTGADMNILILNEYIRAAAESYRKQAEGMS